MDLKSKSLNNYEVIEIDFQTVCRLCGNVSDQLIPLFEDEGTENELPNKLSLYLSMLKIAESDDLPKKICVQCTNAVLVWHDFVSVCIAADKKLANMVAEMVRAEQNKAQQDLRPKITHTDANSMQKKDLRKIEYVVDNEATGHFDEFEDDSQDFIKIENMYALSEGDDERPQCSKADETTTTVVENGNKISRNQKSQSTTANPEPKINQKSTPAPAKPEAPNEPQPKPEKCQFCDHECATKPLLFDHYKDQHCDLVFHCEQCGDYLDRNDLIAHMIGHAMSGLLAGGDGANKTTDVPSVTEKPTAPAICGKTESRKNGDTVKAGVVEPLILKPKVATTQCHVCDEAVVPKQMTAHFEATHPHLDKNECPQCGSQFGCRRLLLNHIKAVHQTKRDYECSECFKTFKVESNLYQHKQSHQANSPNFQCAYCDKTFHFRANLKNHLLVHTKSFSYECSVCKKRFNNQANLTKHMFVHKTDTFSCHMCDFICKQRRYLDDHIKRRHRRAVLDS